MTVGRGLGTAKDGPGKVEEERDICMMFPCGLGTRLLGTWLLGMWLLGGWVLANEATGNAGCSETGAGILCDYMGRGREGDLICGSDWRKEAVCVGG